MQSDYQLRVRNWLSACFGREIAADQSERLHRFLEEALELAQAGGCTREDAHALVEYVFSRPLGDVRQEVGGVMVTLAGFCQACDVDMQAAGESELQRVWARTAEIQAKRARKPFGTPLPQ